MASWRREDLPATALAALVLGWVLCALFLLAFEWNRFTHSFVFVFIVPPHLLISGVYLIFRCLRRPKKPISSGGRLRAVIRVIAAIAELLSWFVIAAYLAFLSYYPRLGDFQTLGQSIYLLLVFYSFASLFSLPIMLVRKTALQQRVMKLPNYVAKPLVILLVSILVTLVVLFLASPEETVGGFPPAIGDHRC